MKWIPKSKTLAVLTFIGGLLAGGCYPNGMDVTEDTDVVITYHNTAYDFTAKATYALPDYIVKVTGNLEEGDDPEFIDPVYGDQILDRIALNMNNLGYTRVDIDADPDLILAPAAWETTTIVYYYDYWDWWWGGYYPYWGYPPVYATSYTTGTLLITMFDPAVLGTNGQPIVQWTAAMNGLLTYSFNASRVYKAVDKSFSQSPYLKTN